MKIKATCGVCEGSGKYNKTSEYYCVQCNGAKQVLVFLDPATTTLPLTEFPAPTDYSLEDENRALRSALIAACDSVSSHYDERLNLRLVRDRANDLSKPFI